MTPSRRAVAGLLSFAAAEEETLLFTCGDDPGTPDLWGAVPLVAHDNEFKSQQAERLRALAAGQAPPVFGAIDHASPAVYQAYCAVPRPVVTAECRRVSSELIDATWALADEDLLGTTGGRLLWLQIIVRGFWHPTGHLGDYYLAHDQPERAVAMQVHALATARYLDAPPPAAGMAGYNLACAQARAGLPEQAARSLADAIAANPDLRANADRDPDLVSVVGGADGQ